MRIRECAFPLVAVALLSACGGPVVIPEYSEVTGTYWTTMIAADTPWMEMTLYLRDDFSAEVSSDYLNGEPPISETGTWIINGDGTITVRLTETGGTAMYPVISVDFVLESWNLRSVSWDEMIYGSEGLTLQRL